MSLRINDLGPQFKRHPPGGMETFEAGRNSNRRSFSNKPIVPVNFGVWKGNFSLGSLRFPCLNNL